MAHSLRDPRYKKIIDALIAARAAAGLTQRDLAARLRQTPSYVAKVETRQRRLDLVELIDVLEAIGVRPSTFIAAVLSDLKKRP